MNTYLKNFLMRGLVFGGFGPIIAGVIYAILEGTLPDFSLNGTQVCIGVISTYLLAFLQAGASVFNQIEHWSMAKSLFCHLLTVYAAYSLCYIVNGWIPFRWEMLLLFTAIFAVIYFAVYLTVYIIVKLTCRRLNRSLNR